MLDPSEIYPSTTVSPSSTASTTTSSSTSTSTTITTPTTPMPFPDIVTRRSWGLIPLGDVPPRQEPFPEVYICHYYTDKTKTHCTEKVFNIN